MTRILVTSALPYINGIKHLGNLVGSMLPADVYARYRRQCDDEVVYICATDEHGTPAELAAAAANMSVKQYCDEQYEVQAKACSAFGLTFDHFGRSSNPANHQLTQEFADFLEDNGLIEERVDPQIYSNADQRFLPDRYVEGICPHCDYIKARGDQCDSCGRLLDPVDLKEPYSAVSGSHDVEIRETRHLYLLQSKQQKQIEEWLDTKTEFPSLTRSIAKKWLKEGLRDRAITRDLKWGIPVLRNGKPRPGFENKVFYVWFDAPIEYIAATKEWAIDNNDDWQRWWRNDCGADDVYYVQVMGKDNVAFHTVSFPATLLGSGKPWKTVDSLKSLNWLTWYGGKFSTSEGRGIFMDQALEILPADYWRWYLMSNAPESDDSSFTLEIFSNAVNKDLADVLGNFVNRVTRFCASKYGNEVPDQGKEGALEEKLAANIQERIHSYGKNLKAMEFRKACVDLRAIWGHGNEYIQESAPWTVFKNDPDQAAVSIRTGLNLIYLFAQLSLPIIPFTAKKMMDIFPEKSDLMTAAQIGWPDDVKAALTALPPGTQFETPDVLFTKIDADQIAEWSEKFGAQ